MLYQHFRIKGWILAYGCKLKLESSVDSLKDLLKDNFFNGEEGREGDFW